MTYCVALRLNRGIVFAADTRTNAGVDNIAQFRKIHYWSKPGERVLVLLTAGNLSLTQSVVSLINEQLAGSEDDPEAPSLFNVPTGAPNSFAVVSTNSGITATHARQTASA